MSDVFHDEVAKQLLSCPFCGTAARYSNMAIRCPNCGVLMPLRGRGAMVTVETLIRLWNRRKSSKQENTENEELPCLPK